MDIFFKTPHQFWFSFVFSFLFCTGVGTCIQCWFIIKFCNIKSKKRYYALLVVFSYLASLASFTQEVSLGRYADTLLGVAVLFCFIKWGLGQNYILSTIVAALTVAITVLVESMLIPLHDLAFQVLHLPATLSFVLLDVLSLFCSYFIYAFFVKRYSVKSQPRARYLLSFVLPIFFIATALRTINGMRYAISYGALALKSEALPAYEQISMTIVAFLCICAVLFAYEKTIQQIDSENESILLAAEISAQKKYVAQTKEKYEETKAFRHDFANHIIALRGLINQNELVKASSYLDRFEKIHTDITFAVNTGNTVVDILLCEKLSHAKKLGINVKCDVDIPASVKIDDFDLCAVFANTLDNAIAACNGLTAAEKTIDIAAKPHGQFFVMDMINHYKAGGVQGGSGTGLTTVRFIAEKYHGAVEISDDDSTFRISVLLPFSGEE